MKNKSFNGKMAVRHADPRHTSNFKNATDLELEADALSNYSGPGVGYVGFGDDFLDFAGQAVSLASAAAHAKPFIITFTNANAAPRKVLLCPGLLLNAPGYMATGAFNDANGQPGLSGQSASPGSIEEFNQFIQRNPSVIAGMKVATANLGQIEQNFTLVKRSPFQSHSSKVITPGIYASEQNFNTAILTIPEPFYMDSQTLMEYTILGNTTVVITLMIGVSLNVSKALRAKTEKGKATIAQMGGSAAVSRFIG